MEIKLNSADFSANALTRLTDGIKEYLTGCYLANGTWSANNKYYKSSVVIEITSDMRNNGFVINNMANITDEYSLVVFFSGSTPSTENCVGNIKYSKGSNKLWKVYASQIPETATHFVVNFLKSNDDGTIYENYFIPVVDDYGFVDGYISNNGSLISDNSFHTTKMIPVSGGIYKVNTSYIATYDKYGAFIQRIPVPGWSPTRTFDSNVYFVRLSATKVIPCSIEY